MFVSCLTATRGRSSVLSEALTCFLAQDYPERELIILNNHPTPLNIQWGTAWQNERDKVRVIEGERYATLGECRQRLLQLARGELVRTWDDDDLYLPWAIRDGVLHTGNAPACKPALSWACAGRLRHELTDNVFEAATTVYKKVAEKYGYQASGGDEHEPLLHGIEREGGCHKYPVDPSTASYIYNYASGLYRISGTLGTGTVVDRTKAWEEMNNDCGPVGPVDLRKRWFELVASVWRLHGKEQALVLAKRLGVET